MVRRDATRYKKTYSYRREEPRTAEDVCAVCNTILNGVGPPADSLGLIDDLYIDTTTMELYGPKPSDAGPWGSPISLAASGGAASPVDSVQYNGGGYFLGSSAFTFVSGNLYLTGTLSQGNLSVALGQYSHAEGGFTLASAIASHAEGGATHAMGAASHAEGYLTTASFEYAHAEGESSIASGRASHAEGYLTTASAQWSHTEGYETRTLWSAAHAEGYRTIASQFASHAEGLETIAFSAGSHAEGQLTLASAGAAHAEGYFATASALYAHAEGEFTLASGRASHVEGYMTTASAWGSHAEGWFTLASKEGAHAEGGRTTASGDASHSEGAYTLASAEGSHAEGYFTTASANYAHAEGWGTEAIATYSHTAGLFTIASGSGQNVVGKYNSRNNADSLFIVGNGDGDSNALRSDIFLVNSGSVMVGSASLAPDTFFYVGLKGAADKAVFSGTVKSVGGFSGSLTKLYGGEDYLLAGGNVILSTSSLGQIQISTTGLAPSNAQFLTLSTNVSLSDERQFSPGVGLSGQDGGAGGLYTLSINDSVVATISGSTFAGVVNFNQGLSGSLTKLVNNDDYLVAGTGISLSTGSNGSITISSTAITSPGGSDTQVQFNDSNSFNGDSSFTFNKNSNTLSVENVVVSGDLTVNGTMTTVNSVNLEVKDSVIGLGFSSGTISEIAGDRGIIVGLRDVDHATFLWKNADSEFVLGRTQSSATGSLPITLTTYSNLHVANLQALIVTASLGFSGSLTKLVDGSDYLTAGAGISLLTGVNGSVTISSTAITPPASPDTGIQFNNGGVFGASANFTFANNNVYLSGSFSNGNQTEASGQSTHAEGYLTTASYSYAHSEGYDTLALGEASHVEGKWSEAIGSYSHAEGVLSVAGGSASHAEGSGSLAAGVAAHSEGHLTSAPSDYSHAEGWATITSGSWSHAEGRAAITSGSWSHAEGVFTIARGEGSHAEGSGSLASGVGSHAEGKDSTALGDFSHAGGLASLASGYAATSIGSGSVAAGNFSFAAGEYTIASGSAQSVFGKFNKTLNSDSLFVVGNGYGNYARSDLLIVNTGSVLIGSASIAADTFFYVGTNPEAATSRFDGDVVVSGTLNVKNGNDLSTLSVVGSKVGIGTSSPGYELEVIGEFAATVKSFVVSHPNKQGWKLRHGTLEGPENGVYVRGRSKERTVKLPDYWENFVDEDSITVHITPIKMPDVIYVTSTSIHEFTVDCVRDDIEYYYVAQAARIDHTFEVEYQE